MMIVQHPAPFRVIRHLSASADPVQRIWSELRFHARPVGFDALAKAANADAETVMTALNNWLAAGCLLGSFEPHSPQPMGFIMTDRARALAKPPITDLDAAVNAGPIILPKRNGRQRIWSAMRVLGRFDLPALMMASGATKNAIADYLNWLGRAGYVVVLPKTGGRFGGHKCWKLLNYSGPRHPHMLRMWADGGPAVLVTDGNTGERQVFAVRPKSRIDRDITPAVLAKAAARNAARGAQHDAAGNAPFFDRKS